MTSLQGRKTVVGAKQLKKVLANGRAEQVYLAENADPALTKPIEVLCHDNHVECIWVPDMKALGHACGIDVGAAAAAVLN